MIKILTLLLFLGSCSTIPEVPQLSQTLKLFHKSSGRNVVIPRIVYKPLATESAGYYNRLENTIYINSRVWIYLTALQQEMILIHELGHGALHRPHLNKITKDGCPESIMLYNIGTVCYLRYKAYYLAELFENKGEFYR